MAACGGRAQQTATSSEAGSTSQSGSAGTTVTNAGGSKADMDAGGSSPDTAAGGSSDIDAGGQGGTGGSAADEALCPSGPKGGSSSCGPSPRTQSLHGTGFTEREGQRVVSPFGETVVTDGSFFLYLGYYGFCNRADVYRFDTDGDGRCSDGDQVHRTNGGFLGVTPDNPGEVASCADFPSGEDLAFEGDARGVGLLRVGLFHGDQTISDFYLYQLDSFVGTGVAGRLQVGNSYTLRAFSTHLCSCSGVAPTWQHSFVATAGRNVVELAPMSATSPGPCF